MAARKIEKGAKAKGRARLQRLARLEELIRERTAAPPPGSEPRRLVWTDFKGKPLKQFDGSPENVRRFDKRIAQEAEPAVQTMLLSAGVVQDGHIEVPDAARPGLILSIAKRLGVRAVFSESFRFLLEEAALDTLGERTKDGRYVLALLGEKFSHLGREPGRAVKMFKALGPLLGRIVPAKFGPPLGATKGTPKAGRPRKPWDELRDESQEKRILRERTSKRETHK